MTCSCPPSQNKPKDSTLAATYANTACQCAANAKNSETAAQAALTSFQTVYLGAYASDPTTTQVGALYFNTTSDQMFIWDGSNWVGVSGSGVAYLASNQTFTGQNIFSANIPNDAVRITQEGNGNALVVEDSTNPDSTPFRISNIGTVHVGTNSTTNQTNTILELDSTSRGFLPPRMSTFFRNLIVTPPAGLMIYNTTTSKLNVYNGTTWEQVTSS